MKLTKLSARRDWVNNSLTAAPASWQVAGTDVFLIGHASGMAPYYTIKKGGEWDGTTLVGGITVERRVEGFKHAKRAAFAAASLQEGTRQDD